MPGCRTFARLMKNSRFHFGLGLVEGKFAAETLLNMRFHTCGMRGFAGRNIDSSGTIDTPGNDLHKQKLH
jgi:hypothetical protein